MLNYQYAICKLLMHLSVVRPSNGIKPQNILILLKIAIWRDREDWKGIDLAKELELSPFEVSIGLERCWRSGLLDASKRKLMRSALQEFLAHGLKNIPYEWDVPVNRKWLSRNSRKGLERDDFLGSADTKDIVALVDGCEGLVDEIQRSEG